MTTTAPASKKKVAEQTDPALAYYRLGDEIMDTKAPDVPIEKM